MITQITHGIRSILSRPFIYTAFQSMMGAHRGRKQFIINFMKSLPGMEVLDVGCGSVNILAYKPEVDYYGFDINNAYINQAYMENFTASNY